MLTLTLIWVMVTLMDKRLKLAAQKSVGIQYMVGPRHALTLRSKGQNSNPNPNPRVRVLTFVMCQDAEQHECACRYNCTFL